MSDHLESVFVCYQQYSLGHSLPLRVFTEEHEAQEWVKDEAINADWRCTPKYVEIEVG